MADHPADVRAAPPDLAGLHAVEIVHRPFQRDEMTAIVAHYALRDSGRARRVEDVERIGGGYRHARRGLAGVERGLAQRRPIMIAARGELASLLRPLQDDAGLGLAAGEADRLVEQRLVLHDAPGLDAAARREDQLRLGVVDAGRKLLGREAAEHHAVHRADPRAGEHRDDGLRHHRHIEDDAIALGDAEILHHRGQRLHLRQQFGIGEFGGRVGERRIVDQRDLAGAAAGDMAIQRVVAGVDHGAGEPAPIGAHRGIEDLLGRLDPVDLARRFRPKALGVPKRAGIHLMIPALALYIHSVSPGSSLASWPGLSRPSTSLGRQSKTWMPGTRPGMTNLKWLALVNGHCHGPDR
ncbi:hypothetical protein ABIF21_003195 [Bradyrhizobium elkanii]